MLQEVASLLVYLEGERLDELLPECVAGDTWLLGPDTFPQPQIERLDEHSWLFIVSGTRCIAVLRNPRIDGGMFIGGTALVTNHDLGRVLPRLGCMDGNVAAWAAIPRVLPPSDLDLLRYELGLSDEEDVDPVLPDDDRTRELRAAVWDDPLSDDARLVYADYLQDRGDPRGELVGIQVSRARSGDHVSNRERLLVRRIAPDCAQPLTPYLVPGFELRRGFLAKCLTTQAAMPEAICLHPAWRTVEDLSTLNVDLLTSPYVLAPRAGVGGRQLLQLVDHVRPLPFETIVGMARSGQSQRGVWIEEGGWDHVANTVGALANVTTISVNPAMSGIGARLIPLLLRAPIGKRLRHVDAFIELQFAEAQRWRDAFDYGSAALLTLRFIVDKREVLVGLRRSARLPSIIVQVADSLAAEHVTVVMRLVAQLARNLQSAELHDLGGHDQQVLLERMNAMFAQVTQPANAKPLAP
jgi:uncharacterized protein (TIGR02996 family)